MSTIQKEVKNGYNRTEAPGCLSLSISFRQFGKNSLTRKAYPPHLRHPSYLIAANALRALAIVASMTASSCRAETKPASKAAGAR
jgi:hypothetical protein